MPLFEFSCLDCGGRRFSALVGVVANAPTPRCPRCGGERLQKQVSRFARIRSEDEAIDALADAADRLDESDPQSVRRFARDMAVGMDDEIGADEIEALMDDAAGSDDDSGFGSEEA